MKTIQIIAAVAALTLSASLASANNLTTEASTSTNAETIAPQLSALNLQNGITAGKALVALYKQYKSDGKLDFSNTTNLTNLVSLVSNIKGLTNKSTTSSTPADFLSGLISGSNNLVNNSNANSVLGALGSIANLDTNSLAQSATTAAANAATKAAGSAISKLFGGSGSTSSGTTSSTNTATSTATSVLTKLFSSLK